MSQDVSLTLGDSQEVAPSYGSVLAVLLMGHLTVDALAALVPSSLAVFEAETGLTASQGAWLLGIGPLVSGFSQPACALVSDYQHTRVWGVVGLGLAGIGICSMGLAGGFFSLAAIYILGMIGVGMFHPVAATTIGHLKQQRRNSAVSLFFVSGMIGGALGAFLWPRFLTQYGGFRHMPLVMIPVLLLALAAQLLFNRLPSPRTSYHWDSTTPVPRSNWVMVGFLYVSACVRFCVNVALFYLFTRWVQAHFAEANAGWSVEQLADSAAPVVGELVAASMVGMAVGGLVAGQVVRPGREKIPMVLVPILFAPVVALFPFTSLRFGHALALLSGVGFASMIPINIALAQKLLPHRANLASSLMMGGAWMTATLGPPLAEASVSRWGLSAAFLLTAAALAVSGLLCVPLRIKEIE